MINDLVNSKKVAYFHGCFANYYYPKVGEAMIEVLRKNGVMVAVPKQKCCGLPMLAKGNLHGANAYMASNVGALYKLVMDGYSVISTCPSCTLFLKKDYVRWLGSFEAKIVADNAYQATEYLLRLDELGELNRRFAAIAQTIYYHTPCHLRAQEIGRPTVKLLKMVPGTSVIGISEECCGMGGAYGNEHVNYDLAKNIATRMYSSLKANPTDRIVTECGGCKLQIEAGIGCEVDHPMVLLREAYNT